MGPKEENWIERAFEDYRRSQADLAALRAMKRSDVGFFIDELADALLDLKQAVVDVDPVRAETAMFELNVLRSEIEDILKGGSS